MLEIFFIILIIFFVLIFFYKQTVPEFSVLQIEADKLETLPDILSESHPIVIRGLGNPKVADWTCDLSLSLSPASTCKDRASQQASGDPYAQMAILLP